MQISFIIRTSTRNPFLVRLQSRTFVPNVNARTGPIMGDTCHQHNDAHQEGGREGGCSAKRNASTLKYHRVKSGYACKMLTNSSRQLADVLATDPNSVVVCQLRPYYMGLRIPPALGLIC